ncbi:hypothetical protein F4775DRAFT_592208 [Biscogniauxia sp. FL1348]|nr:hypothetical protein F4775DRAFT_592208 [Biscogniauxia sp. FL1348]
MNNRSWTAPTHPKLTSVVVSDYGEDARWEFAVCIRTVAISPTKSKLYDFQEVRRMCQTSTLAAPTSPALPLPVRERRGRGARAGKGAAAEYLQMRGETESKLPALASELGGVEVGIARPGLISAPGAIVRSVLVAGVGWASGVSSISVTEIAAVMLDQVVGGLDKEPLNPADLARLAAKSGEGGVA